MASVKFPEKQLTELRAFVTLIKSQPEILHQPELEFFKSYIESIGGVIPAVKTTNEPKSCPFSGKPKESEKMEEEEDELVESDVELDVSGVIEPDNDSPQDMGDSNKVMAEEDEEAWMEKKSAAMMALSEQNYEKAVEHFTDAIKMNPQSAIMFAKRANCYLHLQKPNACIRDCNRAVELNPDSAAAHKYRGRANRLLGKWEEAAKDLRLACKIDYDDQANEWLKEVSPNAKKLEEHRRKYDRLRQEQLVKERQERVRRAQEEHEKAARQQKESANAFDFGPDGSDPFAAFGGMGGMGGMGGGMPGMGGMGGGSRAGGMGGMGGGPGGMDFGSLLSDPEVLAAFQDPEVAQAFQDVSSNPMNYAKYENNPKIKSVINKLASKFGGMGGVPGGFPGRPKEGGFQPADDNLD